MLVVLQQLSASLIPHELQATESWAGPGSEATQAQQLIIYLLPLIR